jgi:eukaryotic-like serine/threonine-protein kinase
MALQPGATLGPYEILSLIGAGGMGEVWLAKDLSLHRKVALKLLPTELTQNPTRVARFQQEARAASALNHPNVCTIHALGETSDGQQFIAMEYVEGETLRQRLQSTRLTIREGLEIAIPVASAIGAAHAGGIVHRDIKPENVMLRRDALVKVLDFGLVKLAPSHALAGPSADTTRLAAAQTDPGTVVGTVAYMSPEQARGSAVDARTDIWSLGVVLYEMVTGRVPFGGASSSDVLVAILDREPAPLARFDPDAPAELQRIISKTLRKNREQRYQVMQDLLLDLQALRDQLAQQAWMRASDAPHTAAAVPADSPAPPLAPGVVRPQSSTEYLVTQFSRHKLVWATIGALFLAVIATAVWWTAFARRQVPHAVPAREPVLTRLTANPADLSLMSARISPDGRYLAYAHPSGIDVQFIDTGETQRLPETRGMDVYAWSRDSTRVRASACGAETCVGWDISLIGGGRRRSGGVWPRGEYTRAMPDGSRLLRVGPGGQLTVDLLNGAPPRVLMHATKEHFIGAANWSVDGNRILFVTDGSAIERVSLGGGPRSTLFRADKGQEIADLIEVPKRGMVAILTRPGPVTQSRAAPEVSLWRLHTDINGSLLDAPHQVTEWRQEDLEQLSASSDGQRLAFLSTVGQFDVYVAGFDPRIGLTGAPTRFTLDDRDDGAEAWTPDSTAVLFASSRNGTLDIFKQRLGSDVAEPVVSGPGDQFLTRVTSDGQWLLYAEGVPTLARGAGEAGRPDTPVRWMRMPLSGGGSELLFPTEHWGLGCSARSGCMIFTEQGSETVISSVDPVKGKGAELGRVPVSTGGGCILPDGNAFAYVVNTNAGSRNRIRVVSFKGQPSKDFIVQNVTNLEGLTPLASGSGFFSTDHEANRTNLVFVKPDGTSRILWSPTQLIPWWTVPSPDGKHLAITVGARYRNAWMLTDF